MIKNSLASIAGVSIYPIISLLIFVSFFVILGITIFSADNKYINHMAELPLEDDEIANN